MRWSSPLPSGWWVFPGAILGVGMWLILAKVLLP
jgi:hypothetical protein